MAQYSVQARDRTFVKGYGFLSFARNMGKYIGININKNLSKKYSQKLFDHATDALKTSPKRAIQRKAEATGDLIGNKISDRITKVSKTLPPHNSETNKEEIFRERYISPEKRQQIINDLRLI